ncbi:zinc finger protein 821-like [Drosophila obscura]|uniref:zinc finger protein 821-like n=1 Tax=Drosophila obscura TaxID=7282 RepID=UPI000BA060D0|nr:zinc finger protein 821-like [Drosophila obscura]
MVDLTFQLMLGLDSAVNKVELELIQETKQDQSTDKKNQVLLRKAVYQRQRRDSEDIDMRNNRLNQMRERARIRRSVETPAERTARLSVQSTDMEENQEIESAQHRAERLQKMREKARSKRANESLEEGNQRRAKQAAYARMRRQQKKNTNSASD